MTGKALVPAIELVDHLVFAVTNLQAGSDYIAEMTGVRPVQGGSHPQWGTANVLLSLGEGMYLEVIGPDPDQPGFTGKRVFGIDELTGPTLQTWAARSQQIERMSEIELSPGLQLGKVLQGERQRPDGVTLRWKLTDPQVSPADGQIPFLIDWGDTPHPSTATPQGVTLVGLRFEHPQPDLVADRLERLGITVEVASADTPAIIASLDTPRGSFELR